MESPLSPLEGKFHQAMLDIYTRAKDETGYNATRFLNMVRERGGLATAHYLLAGKVTDVSEGFTQLALKGRLDLAVESVVQEPEWTGLFSEAELKIARQRLRANERKG
jgi:hypothetical protein